MQALPSATFPSKHQIIGPALPATGWGTLSGTVDPLGNRTLRFYDAVSCLMRSSIPVTREEKEVVFRRNGEGDGKTSRGS